MTIIPLTKTHWPVVEKIYLEGISTEQATFETESPGWAKWNLSHHLKCRFAAVSNGTVVGWVALSPVSNRVVYFGVAEVSFYIAPTHKGRGIGQELLEHLIKVAEKEGYYSLQAVMFPENLATLRLHEKCGFRKIGLKEKVAKLNGVWRNTVLYERRSKSIL
ncbi:MAG: N-acetyltransferase [Cyclobacteriaceae bacterium]